MMLDLPSLFPNSAAIDPAAPEERRADFAGIPAKAAVYLLTSTTQEAESHPVLLATVGDLRAALRRRLADTPAEVKSKRVPYGQICTRVHYRVVHSAFAANYYYAQAARELFPETAAALIPWHTSWWVAVERPGVTPHPRFRKTSNLSDESLAYAGPIRDKHAANRLVESLEDLFDLCRYHNILVQAPHGKACAYKEMGKCPAPCDGSMHLDVYQTQISAALGFLTNAAAPTGPSPREAWRGTLESQMKAAAALLQFESAAKIKQRLSRAGLLNTEPFAATAALEDFAFLTLQPGQGKPWIEPWLIHFGPGIENQKSGAAPAIENSPIRPLAPFNLKRLPAAADELAAQCRGILAQPRATSLTPDQSAHAALVAHHLFKADSDHGIWLRLSAIARQGSAAIISAAEKLRAKKTPKPLAEQSTDTVEPSEAV